MRSKSIIPTVVLALTGTAFADGYLKPPQPILDAMKAPSPPSPSVSPTGKHILLVSWQEYPSLTRVAEPFLRLAGVRVEPRNHGRRDTPGGYGLKPCAEGYAIVDVATGAETKVTLPAGCPGGPVWNADGTRFAFSNAGATSIELWLGDTATGQVHRVPSVALNPMLDFTAQWLPDQKSLIVKLVPDGMGPPPPAPSVPPGPSTMETNGEQGESSTYEARDTLKDAHDVELFDYFGASQLAVVDAATGAVKRVGKPDVYQMVDAAPDGRHLLVEKLRKPYSYVVTADRFARDVLVWDLQTGETHLIAALPLADRVPVQGVQTGPREFEWRANEAATLVWAEALDGGDWKAKVPNRDKVMLQKAPFTAQPVEILRTQQRYTGFAWSSNTKVAFLGEEDANRHWVREFIVNVDDRKAKPRVLWDMSEDEHYKNPGWFVMKVMPNGSWLVRQEGDAVYLSGSGGSPTGDRPFLDKLDLGSLKTERLFRSERTAYEKFLAFASPSAGERRLLTWHQTPMDPPNAFLRTLGAPAKGAAAGEPAFASATKQVTHIPDPLPAAREIKKRLVSYKRADGTDLSFTLYTPPGYKEGTRIPAILYAYPLDYADPTQAGQVVGSEQTFTKLKDYRLMVLAGYALLDDASFPVVGDPKKAYDTYLEQLVADAKAAVDKAVEIGVVDPERIGVTGHSHGALMTVNLLAHSDLFRAGVASSGSYNKTLTPFGFQTERRSVWEAQDVYLKVSPFFFADKLKAPLLIVHGADDANPGTTPLQATKLYEAIRGNGGIARLVMLPFEPHWYTAEESNEEFVAEMLRWFDRYVKNAAPRHARL